jgi:peptidoglycan/LPS O-acetylase OafA/YrhL
MSSPATPLRRDIQALRGAAVLAVIAFHYRLGGISGGFLGVDIFFVLSGFVITQRLMGFEGNLRKSLQDFYLKRAKRLLPTAWLVVLLTAIFARIALPSIALAQIARESLATSLFIPNLFFAHEQNNYLNQGLDPSPYLHYWSLGVEEQFYLLCPLIMLLLLRKRAKGVAVTLILATLATLTLGQNDLLTAFYQPWFRAWEFLAGALIFFIPPLTNSLLKVGVALMGWAGLIASITLIDSAHADPGITTLFPIISTCFVLVAALSFSRGSGLIYLGNISYVLYLIHWPLFIILTSRYPGLNAIERSLIFFAAVSISALISKYFESPLRRSRKISSLRSFALPMALVALISFGALQSGASASSGSLKISRAAPILYQDGCHLSFNQSTPKAGCFFGDLTSSTLIILVGDSHAAMHFPGINLLAEKNHWKLLALTKSSCPAAIINTIRAGKVDRACATWQRNLPTLFMENRAKYILMAGATEEGYVLTKQSPRYPEGFSLLLDAALRSGATPVLLSDTPYPGVDSPSCLLRHLKNFNACDPLPPHSTTTQAVAAIAESKGALVLRPELLLCKGGRCAAVFHQENVYRDSSHISIGTSLRLEALIAQVTSH